MDRNNHYEAAFEGYLQWHRLCYVGVDESRRSQDGDASVKSLDFIVFGATGQRYLIDVKGRRYPSGSAAKPSLAWQCWSMQEDVEGLCHWSERYGSGFQSLLLFIYELTPQAPPIPPEEELWTWQGRRYLLRAIAIEDYRAFMKVRSPRWRTVDVPQAAFRRLSRPFMDWMQEPVWLLD
jgi:hypothetical protein